MRQPGGECFSKESYELVAIRPRPGMALALRRIHGSPSTAFTFTHPVQYNTPTITISNHVGHAVAVEATSIANTSEGWVYYVHASSGCRGEDHAIPWPGADPESL